LGWGLALDLFGIMVLLYLGLMMICFDIVVPSFFEKLCVDIGRPIRSTLGEGFQNLRRPDCVGRARLSSQNEMNTTGSKYWRRRVFNIPHVSKEISQDSTTCTLSRSDLFSLPSLQKLGPASNLLRIAKDMINVGFFENLFHLYSSMRHVRYKSSIKTEPAKSIPNQRHRIIIQTAATQIPISFYCTPYTNAMPFLISAIANAGFNPLGHVLEQLRIVWHRYKLIELLRASCRSAVFSSRESAIQR
jgi:hypothetical protein